MIERGLFLMDGPSDAPIAEHLELLCSRRGHPIRISTPDLRRLNPPPGLRVEDRLSAVLQLEDEGSFDIVFVHRDAEKMPPERRVAEVEDAVQSIAPHLPRVAVVPIRMTEAWLLLDEDAIRTVAGKPSSHAPLDLPSNVETVPDPKMVLRDALLRASGLSGRRLKSFGKRFGEHRRMLLQRLDIDGPVKSLGAWQLLESAIDDALPTATGHEHGG